MSEKNMNRNYKHGDRIVILPHETEYEGIPIVVGRKKLGKFLKYEKNGGVTYREVDTQSTRTTEERFTKLYTQTKRNNKQ